MPAAVPSLHIPVPATQVRTRSFSRSSKESPGCYSLFRRSERERESLCFREATSLTTTHPTAMKFSGAMVALVCLVVLSMLGDNQQAQAMPPVQCSPNLIDEVPPRIRRICAALSTIYELGSAMESFINEKASAQVLREGIPLLDSGVKRQDVDHVFLRFGRRR